jgi:hypothetical protein
MAVFFGLIIYIEKDAQARYSLTLAYGQKYPSCCLEEFPPS